jgi:hypothetical protein
MVNPGTTRASTGSLCRTGHSRTQPYSTTAHAAADPRWSKLRSPRSPGPKKPEIQKTHGYQLLVKLHINKIIYVVLAK